MLYLELPRTCCETRGNGSALLIRRHFGRIALRSPPLIDQNDPGAGNRFALRVGCLDSDGFGATPGLSPGRSDDDQGEKARNQGQEAVVVHRIPLRLRQREAKLFDHCSRQLTLREALEQAVARRQGKAPSKGLP